MPYNGYSEEYLDRLENGSIPTDNKSYNKRKLRHQSLGFLHVIRADAHPHWEHFESYLLSAFLCFSLKLNSFQTVAGTIKTTAEEKGKKFSNYSKIFSSRNAINENNGNCCHFLFGEEAIFFLLENRTRAHLSGGRRRRKKIYKKIKFHAVIQSISGAEKDELTRRCRVREANIVKFKSK